MKAKYKAKVNRVITKMRFPLLFSSLNVVKDMLSKLVSINIHQSISNTQNAEKMWNKFDNVTPAE